ncbi:MAG: protein-disulfide reductase DsbD domain-containing protein [Bryobacteraceae bacterium]
MSLGEGKQHLELAQPPKAVVKRGASALVRLPVRLEDGYHVNSDTPEDEYLIPLRLRWEPGPLVAAKILYPQPHVETLGFSKKPMAVFSGEFEIVTRFEADPKAPAGPGILGGKLRYQACNGTTCFMPKTIDISLAYEIQ